MPKIKTITAREVLDSRGNPTVEVEVVTESGATGRAIVPSGASTGVHEVVELRDKDLSRYKGKGVQKAVNNVNTTIANKIIGLDVTKQILIDNTLIKEDGTSDRSCLGANAILGVSLAVLKAAAAYYAMPLYRYIGGVNAKVLPIPMMNILNGGAHACFSIDFQEIMIVPHGAKSFKEALQMGSEIYMTLGVILRNEGYTTTVGDEGGFAPSLPSNEKAIELVLRAIKEANYIPGQDVSIALDVAASEFYNENTKLYELKRENKSFSSKELINSFYAPLIDKYPLISIEDPLSEDDIEGWIYMTSIFKNKIMLVGDDLFVTNEERLNQGIKLNLGNSILIKYNQVGTISETLETIELAKRASYNIIISHRFGDSEDTTIADLAVGTNSLFIKTGAPCRSERVAKYNQLLRIEEKIKEEAKYGSYLSK